MSPSDENLRLGLVQHAGSPDGVNGNLAIIEQAAAEAARRHIDLLVFPECFLTGYWRSGALGAIAASVDKPVIDRLEACASQTGVALVVGSYELRGQAVFNSAFCVMPREGCIARYSKRALYGEWERTVFTPGRSTTQFDYKGFKIGLLICYDVEFPELVREQARLGSDLVLVPTALMQPYAYIADYVVPARAIENQIFVAYANRIGGEGPFRYVGRSLICGPTGPVAGATAADDETMIAASLSRSVLQQSRDDFSYIVDVPPL